MVFLNNIDQIRQIEWDQGHLWDVSFSETVNKQHKSKLISPFSDWFPAESVNDERFSLSTFDQELHQFSGFPFPSGAQQRSITLGFYDDINNTLLKWVTKWVKTDILNDGKFLTPLARCTKILRLAKLNSQRQMVPDSQNPNIFSYLVIPSGSAEFQGSENPSSTVYSVRFLIVGEEVPKN